MQKPNEALKSLDDYLKLQSNHMKDYQIKEVLEWVTTLEGKVRELRETIGDLSAKRDG